jgi:hypothetical protein
MQIYIHQYLIRAKLIDQLGAWHPMMMDGKAVERNYQVLIIFNQQPL